jgi:hypothetical protein
MPGAVVAVSFGIIIQHFGRVGLKHYLTVFDIKLMGIKHVISIFYIEAQTPANRAFHFSPSLFDLAELRRVQFQPG